MSRSNLTREYRCWNDCRMSGCPGHTATLSYQSVSDAYHYSDGKNQDLYFQGPEGEALLSMLGELSGWRVETESMIRDSRIIEPKDMGEKSV